VDRPAGVQRLRGAAHLAELIALSSRIIVLRNGRVTGEVSRDEATQDGLLRLMTGLEPAKELQSA
jgi:ribose transport system ATP-binding protein